MSSARLYSQPKSRRGQPFYSLPTLHRVHIIDMSHQSHGWQSPSTSDQIESDVPKKQESDLEKTDVVEVEQGVVEEAGLRRALLGRHVSLISLASVIGASCFYAFGNALYLSGPVGALIGFGIVGTFRQALPLATLWRR